MSFFSAWKQASFGSKIFSLVFVISGLGTCASVFISLPIFVLAEVIFLLCIWISACLGGRIVVRETVKNPSPSLMIATLFLLPTFALGGWLMTASLLIYFLPSVISPYFLAMVATALSMVLTIIYPQNRKPEAFKERTSGKDWPK